MSYEPEPVPQGLEEVRSYLERELRRLAAALYQELDHLHLMECHAVPSKPREGQVVFADGTDWNPGSGKGYYGYKSGAWAFLG